MSASRNGHREVVELLLDNKADVQATKEVGGNRLHRTLSKCMHCGDLLLNT